MKFLRANVLYIIILFACLGVIAANDARPQRHGPESAPIETVLISPIEMEAVEVWAPVAKAGPFVNKGCDPQLNCTFTFAARPKMEHTKDPNCPPGVARLLAEYTAAASHCDLPLTIFNGWQWECVYALGDHQTAIYNLIGEGGSWESSWEAKMRIVCSSAALRYIRISDSGDIIPSADKPAQTSSIELKTFSAARTRDGYPKTRQF